MIAHPELGGAVTWDGKDTFLFKMLDDKWTGNVCGLCGNFNGNAVDDFVPKGGGNTCIFFSFFFQIKCTFTEGLYS